MENNNEGFAPVDENSDNRSPPSSPSASSQFEPITFMKDQIDFLSKRNDELVLDLVKDIVEASKEFEKNKDVQIEFLISAMDMFHSSSFLAVFSLIVMIASEQFDRNNFTGCKELLDFLESELPGISHQKTCDLFYFLALKYDRSQKAYADMHRRSTEFWKSRAVLSTEERRIIATYFALSTLLADQVYIFEDVMGDEMVELLKGTDIEWMSGVLGLMKLGKVDEMKQFFTSREFQPETKQTLLHKTYTTSLVRSLAGLPGEKKEITLVAAAETIQRSVDDVRGLLEHCIEANLVEGNINEDLGMVTIYRVKEI